MALAFDTLSYSRHLRDHGVPQDQAEAHADAVSRFVMINLATQQDILSVRQDVTNAKQELQTAMENLGLKLTVRLGVMIVAGVGVLAAILKLAP